MKKIIAIIIAILSISAANAAHRKYRHKKFGYKPAVAAARSCRGHKNHAFRGHKGHQRRNHGQRCVGPAVRYKPSIAPRQCRVAAKAAQMPKIAPKRQATSRPVYRNNRPAQKPAQKPVQKRYGKCQQKYGQKQGHGYKKGCRGNACPKRRVVGKYIAKKRVGHGKVVRGYRGYKGRNRR